MALILVALLWLWLLGSAVIWFAIHVVLDNPGGIMTWTLCILWPIAIPVMLVFSSHRLDPEVR